MLDYISYGSLDSLLIRLLCINKCTRRVVKFNENYQNLLLIYLTVNKDLNGMNYLIARGANPSILNNYILDIAVVKKFTEGVKLALNYIEKPIGDNPIICDACEMGFLEITKLLIEAGANPHIFDDEPLLLAKMNNHIDVIEYLNNFQ